MAAAHPPPSFSRFFLTVPSFGGGLVGEVTQDSLVEGGERVEFGGGEQADEVPALPQAARTRRPTPARHRSGARLCQDVIVMVSAAEVWPSTVTVIVAVPGSSG